MKTFFMNMTTDEDDQYDEEERAFMIIKGKNCLNFVYNVSGALNFPLSESVEGFYDGDIMEIDIEDTYVEEHRFHVDSLKEDGLQYIIIGKEDISADGWVKDLTLPSEFFCCDDELMWIYDGAKPLQYRKWDELPFEALYMIYKRGELDKRDYIKEYLDIKVLTIKPLKSSVYAEPKKKTKIQLNKGDIVILLEEKRNWLRVKYNDSETGWVKKADVIL
jgi:hypothetical protein